MALPAGALAQSTASPDTVCAGSEAYYKIASPAPGSTFAWGLYQAGGSMAATARTDSVRVAWSGAAGIDSLWVVETSAAGCPGDTARLAVVRVAPPQAAFEDAALCHGERPRVELSGTPPIRLEYTLDGVPFALEGLDAGTRELGGAPGAYLLTRVSGRHCGDGLLGAQAAAVVAPALSPLQILHD